MNRVDQWIDKYEDAEEMLLQIKEWLNNDEVWDREEELADQVWDHLRIAAWKMRRARANMDVDEAPTPDGRDI